MCTRLSLRAPPPTRVSERAWGRGHQLPIYTCSKAIWILAHLGCHWLGLIHPPTLTGGGLLSIASGHLPVGSNNQIMMPRDEYLNMALPHPITLNRHAWSCKHVTQLATVYLLHHSLFWSLSTRGNLCNLQATRWSFSAMRWIAQSRWPCIVNT